LTLIDAHAVQSNDTLEELHLDTNQIDDEGIEALAAAVAVSSSLRVLNLSANRMGDVGAAAIAETIKSNKVLEELDLSSNEIAYDGLNPPSMSLHTSNPFTHSTVHLLTTPPFTVQTVTPQHPFTHSQLS
jgi:hypothetical protein